MGRTLLYGKIGRSMPLTLAKCGTLGGDIEMTATLTALATRYPDDTIVLIGRNTGENPRDVDLPPNVFNPWTQWNVDVRNFININKMNHPNLSIDEHRVLANYMDNLTYGTFNDADAIIMWVGQHGTSNGPIPKIGDREEFTKPQDAFAFYSGYLLRGINRWRDINPLLFEPIFLNADPRNYLKMRDLKHPLFHPVLTQFRFQHNIKHERYGDSDKAGFIRMIEDQSIDYDVRQNLGYEADANVWRSVVFNNYSRLELNALMPGTPSGDLLSFNDVWNGRAPFGVVINEARAIGVKYEKSRLHAMHKWIMPLQPSFIHGTWSDKAMESLRETWGSDLQIKPLPWSRYSETMHQVRCTFTTPSSGSGWATTKPWEAFGLGVVCFFHPDYDTQDNILKDAPADLREWLRVKHLAELYDRVTFLSKPEGRETWLKLVRAQRVHFNRNVNDPIFMKMINDRLENR